MKTKREPSARAYITFDQIDNAIERGKTLPFNLPAISRAYAIKAAQDLNHVRKTIERNNTAEIAAAAQGHSAQAGFSNAPIRPLRWYAKAIRVQDGAYANNLKGDQLTGEDTFAVQIGSILHQRANTSSASGTDVFAGMLENLTSTNTDTVTAPFAAQEPHADSDIDTTEEKLSRWLNSD